MRSEKLIQNAINHWFSRRIIEKNHPDYYKFIRKSPIVRFETNKNILEFLKSFGYSKEYGTLLMNSIPKYRNYYIMKTNPFNIPYGTANDRGYSYSRRLSGIPGMVTIVNQNTSRYRALRAQHEFNHLGLVNKALLNRYLSHRSLRGEPMYTLRNARTLTRAADVLFGNIERKRGVVRQTAHKWRAETMGRKLKPMWNIHARQKTLEGKQFERVMANIRARRPKTVSPPSSKKVSPNAPRNVNKSVPRPISGGPRIYVRV